MRPIVLLTDFGVMDHYVGVLHSILEREAAGIRRIDLVHEVPPGDVWAAAFLLRSAWDHLPEAAVILAVVDPGVGSARRAVAARIGSRWLVAPDNGLARAVGPATEVVVLDWRLMRLPEPSATFHGRDLFAPAAARIARGDDPAAIGEAADPAGLIESPLPEPVAIEGGYRATVLHVDRFGNVVTNLAAHELPVDLVARYGAPRGARRVATYSEAEAGEVVVLAGSSGLLELAVHRDSAAEITNLGRGDTVDITSNRSIATEERRTRNEE